MTEHSYTPELTSASLEASVETQICDEYGIKSTGYIAAERPLTLYIDKKEIITLMTIGTQPELLILGWLRNQRFISDISQIKAIQVDWETDSVAVTTFEGIENLNQRMAKKTVTTGCGQGTVFGSLMDDLEKIKLPDVTVNQSQIYDTLHNLNAYNDVYRRAGAVHGCALCQDTHIDKFVEDVGRHNAVDALAGYMWKEQIQGDKKLFYTTGRLTSEMVIKVAQMGIPILLSRSGVTQMGLALAKQLGVILIARAKGKHFLVYNGEDKVILDAMPEPRLSSKKNYQKQAIN